MMLTGHSDEWILDSGYTYHTCPNKDWSFGFKELDGGFFFSFLLAMIMHVKWQGQVQSN